MELTKEEKLNALIGRITFQERAPNRLGESKTVLNIKALAGILLNQDEEISRLKRQVGSLEDSKPNYDTR